MVDGRRHLTIVFWPTEVGPKRLQICVAADAVSKDGREPCCIPLLLHHCMLYSASLTSGVKGRNTRKRRKQGGDHQMSHVISKVSPFFACLQGYIARPGLQASKPTLLFASPTSPCFHSYSRLLITDPAVSNTHQSGSTSPNRGPAKSTEQLRALNSHVRPNKRANER